MDIVPTGRGVHHDIAVSLKELAVQGSRDWHQFHFLNAPHLQSRLFACQVELLQQTLLHDCQGKLGGMRERGDKIQNYASVATLFGSLWFTGYFE